jgi:DNA-binding MarR family transcriptional regulator
MTLGEVAETHGVDAP